MQQEGVCVRWRKEIRIVLAKVYRDYNEGYGTRALYPENYNCYHIENHST